MRDDLGFLAWNDLSFESPFSAWSDPCWHASNIFLNGSSSLAVFEPLRLWPHKKFYKKGITQRLPLWRSFLYQLKSQVKND